MRRTSRQAALPVRKVYGARGPGQSRARFAGTPEFCGERQPKRSCRRRRALPSCPAGNAHHDPPASTVPTLPPIQSNLLGQAGTVLVVELPAQVVDETSELIRHEVQRRLPNADGAAVVLDCRHVDLINSTGI